MAATLEDVADALAARDMEAAERAVARARDIDEPSSRFGEVRATAVDLLRALGLDREAGREAVRQAARTLAADQ